MGKDALQCSEQDYDSAACEFNPVDLSFEVKVVDYKAHHYCNSLEGGHGARLYSSETLCQALESEKSEKANDQFYGELTSEPWITW